ncbi:hypothetical protein [Capnocytophaga catalasegens]|uniref:Uncharacterized protein n=1 Tax=Capnocytophaga catalasegens TaxID=1004260 RepID=A0AAV5AT74_9FLAO|nr:hypothetical protein [Capnocytophaga catalasegens]GIZ15260.1 hypothetical protein RCZ03_12600 [Capnocytophaga catalasegens]GJM49774.1 hypothetical protein RCZ15_07490 [Capnocytophaga catalasegens]GJM52839.1 hypothetical protein RCZ16_11560 [Capnocytophaga catalasegens]
MGGIKLTLKSTGQVMVAKFEVDYYVKIHFIFYVSDFYNSFKAAAFTRKREIEQLGGKRIVFCEEIEDLWEINNIIKTKNLLYFKSQNISNYKTVEVCIYSHSASDGPLGNVEASQYSLSSQTGDNNDKGQITLEGWGKIDFNFHPENSILAFYGL